MPKLFASDIVVIDHETGKRIPARVEVNKPFTYDGISIYQSSFQDGGSKLAMTAWPMTGANAKTTPFDGAIGGTAPMSPQIVGGQGETVEFTDFRAINVENITDGNGAIDARGVGQTHTLGKPSTNASAPAPRPRIRPTCATSGRRCSTRCAAPTARRANSTTTCCRSMSPASRCSSPACA